MVNVFATPNKLFVPFLAFWGKKIDAGGRRVTYFFFLEKTGEVGNRSIDDDSSAQLFRVRRNLKKPT